MIRALLLGLLVSAGGAAAETGATCRSDRFEGLPYTVCRADPGAGDIRLWLRDGTGDIIGSFEALDARLRDRGKRLVFAMNGGMYHADRRPVGYYVEDGQEAAPLVLSDGPGNFGLLPNGVLCLRDGSARLMESHAFAAAGLSCDHATQSGPLLVRDGALHPRFLPDSASVNLRNGVGLRPDGTLVFAISDAPVNFHWFARLFRDALGAPDALFLDGSVSRLFAPGIGRRDFGLPVGPIIGLEGPAD